MINQEKVLDRQDATEIKNYTRVPNMLIFGYTQLSPQEKWLLVCLRHLCGKRGTRHLSLRYISEQTSISTGALSRSKDKNGKVNEGMIAHLHQSGLIHAEIKQHEGRGNPQYHITITDVWQLNQSFFETRSEFGQVLEDVALPVRISDEPVQNSDKLVQISDEPVRIPVQYQDYIQDSNKIRSQESTYTQSASALAQSTHETANGENDATPTLSGHLSGDASDGSEHHVLPAIPGIPGDYRRADVSVDPQIVNGGDNGSDNNNLRDDHNASRHDNRVLDVPRRLEAPPSCEVSEQTPTFSVPPTDEVPPLVLPPNTPSTPGRVEHKATPASGAKPQRKPKKVADGKTSTIGQSRISAIIDCMDATIQQLTGDPQFCFSRSKKAQDTIWDTLIKDRKEGQGVTPTMLKAAIGRMYNTPKDPRSGFDWKENMSIPAICNNFDKFSIGLAAKQPPKVAPVELDAEALEEERRRLEFAIKHAERWAKPAPMAQPQHAVVPIVAKGSGR